MRLVDRGPERQGVFGAVYAFVFALIGTLAVLASIAGFFFFDHGDALVPVALFIATALCSMFRVNVCRRADMPYLVVSLGLLAVASRDPSPMLYAAVWATGYLVAQLIVVRNVPWSLFRAGIGGLAASAFVGITLAGSSLGIVPVVYLIVASIVGLVLILAVDFLRQSLRSRDQRVCLSALRLPRLLMVTCITAALAIFVYYVDTYLIPLLEQNPGERRTPLILIVTSIVFFGVAQVLAARATKRRLDALMRATEAPTWAGGPETTRSTLVELAKAATNAETVELSPSPPRAREIAAEVQLEGLEGDGPVYLVASRPLGAAPFARADERVLESLAQMASEVTRIQDDLDTLSRQARSDPLTGLPNYAAFQEMLIEANENRPTSRGIAVLFADLDDFKRLNDNRGHHIGDEVLKVTASRLVDSVDPQDTVSRIGGDEFVVILKNLSSINDAKAIADRIVSNIGDPFSIDGMEIRPKVSIGLAFSSHREIDPKILVTDADRTMLHLKRSRRQGGPSEGSSVSIASHRSTRMNDIVTRAIRHRRIVLAFQPIVDMRAGKIWAFESLIRYTDPELGPISPSSLVARAKSLGMMDELTRQVMELSFHAASAFREVCEEIHHITVNFELSQMTEDRLAPTIREALRAHPDVTMCIELNERSLVELNDQLREQVQSLRELGAMIALDDYGSEDSSVAALVRLPMDVLKIDKTLVDDLSDVRNQEVIKALQGFGDNLGYTLVVEGVENVGTQKTLLDLGARMAQGFYYGRPQSMATTLKRLTTSGSRAAL